MTAEFNITIPGAEIIKRLTDLETENADLLDRLQQLELTVSANAHQQDDLHDRFIALERNNESIGAYIRHLETAAGEDVRNLRRELTLAIANGGEEIKQVNNRLDRHENLIADLIERGDRLTDVVNGKTARTPEWPNVKPVPTTVAPPYASTSRVERTAEDIADLKDRLESMAKEVTAFTGAVSVLITATDSLHDRIERLEDAAPNWPANDPEPPVGTSWHPFNFSIDLRPDDDKRVVILTRDGVIAGPEKTSAYYWGNDGDGTIVAWRYAKEGE